jgi:hypothetical protein
VSSSNTHTKRKLASIHPSTHQPNRQTHYSPIIPPITQVASLEAAAASLAASAAQQKALRAQLAELKAGQVQVDVLGREVASLAGVPLALTKLQARHATLQDKVWQYGRRRGGGDGDDNHDNRTPHCKTRYDTGRLLCRAFLLKGRGKHVKEHVRACVLRIHQPHAFLCECVFVGGSAVFSPV